MITRFMQVMFSNTDEDLANQVDNDIKTAKRQGEVDTDEVKYEHIGNGNVAITDKENGEVTIAQKATDEADTYDLVAVPDGQLERFVHPSFGENGNVVYGNQVGADDEKVAHHFDGEDDVISPNLEDGGLNPDAGHERLVQDLVDEYDDEDNDDEKSFSVATDNTVVQRIFSDQVFCEYLFSEVIESEETAKVGSLKIEKLPEDDEEDGTFAVVVTDTNSGDQAKVKFVDDEMEVTELDSKEFCGNECGSDECQYEPNYVVGIDPINRVIVDAPVYTDEDAQDLIERLEEDGVDAPQVFETQEEGRDYAFNLLENLGVSEDDVDEPRQAEYSEYDIWITPYYDNNSDYACRMFSEAVNGYTDMQDEVSDAISSGEEIENDDEIITPIDAQTAIVEDKETGEYTRASLSGEDVRLEKIDEETANDLMSDLTVMEVDSKLDETMSPSFAGAIAGGGYQGDDEDEDEVEDEDEEKSFSTIRNAAGTRVYSEDEYLTSYMERLFAEEADQEDIESAIENGEEIETDDEIITPVDSSTAIIEDKETGEYTKATILDDDTINLHPIDEDDADEEMENIVVAPNGESEMALAEEEGKIKNYTHVDETGTRFFSEDEYFTDYMERLFAEEAEGDEEEIAKAIEEGEQVENGDEVITPVDAKTAVVEDKDSGEFTKATLDKDGDVEVEPISEKEADSLTDGLIVEDNDEDEDEDEEKEFSYHDDYILDKFFADIAMQQAQPVAPVQGPQYPQQQVPTAIDGQGNQVPVEVDPQTGEQVALPVNPVPSVEEVEDKAEAAVQSIQAAAAEAAAQIAQAKAAPAPNAEPDLQEAQFSEYYGYYDDYDDGPEDTLISWLGGIR